MFTSGFIVFSKVNPSGEVSNFLIEDYDTVFKFMSDETHKKRLKL